MPEHSQMFKTCLSCLVLVVACASAAQVKVQAALPKRDLLVELREVQAGGESGEGYSVSTAATAPSRVPLSLVVRNGEKGSVRLQQSVPLQWVQSVQSQSSSVVVPGASAASSGGGLSQSLHWLEVGQSITLTPRWPGGKKEVSLELEVQQAEIQTVHNADLPNQLRIQTSTQLTLPLNQWTTIATSGKDPAATGSYNSEARADARRLLQLRVSAP